LTPFSKVKKKRIERELTMTESDVTAPEIAVAEQKAVAIYDRIAAVKISDVQTYVLVGDLLKEVKKVVNKFEEETAPEIKQAHTLHKNLIARTRRWSDKFAEAESLAKAKLEKFYSEQADAHVDLPKLEGVGISETWMGEVTDPDSIPRQYLVPDTGKLLGLTKTLKEATDIPGWRIKKVRTISVRA
jgi:hypothetical protein